MGVKRGRPSVLGPVVIALLGGWAAEPASRWLRGQERGGVARCGRSGSVHRGGDDGTRRTTRPRGGRTADRAGDMADPAEENDPEAALAAEHLGQPRRLATANWAVPGWRTADESPAAEPPVTEPAEVDYHVPVQPRGQQALRVGDPGVTRSFSPSSRAGVRAGSPVRAVNGSARRAGPLIVVTSPGPTATFGDLREHGKIATGSDRIGAACTHSRGCAPPTAPGGCRGRPTSWNQRAQPKDEHAAGEGTLRCQRQQR